MMVSTAIPWLAVDLGLALLFGWAAIAKLRDPLGFRGVVEGYRLLPSVLLMPTALLLPLVELGLAVLLLVRPMLAIHAGAVGAALLLLIYAGALAINLYRGRRHLDCGCLGSADARPTIGWGLVLRNLALASLALLTAAAGGWSVTALSWIDGVSALLAVCLGAVILGATNQMLANSTRFAGAHK